MATQDELLQQAVVAARGGDQAEARSILSELVRQYPREARGWYLLSQLVEQPERAEFCLKKVLEIDPQNAKARQRLEAMQAGRRAAFTPPKTPTPTTQPDEPLFQPYASEPDEEVSSSAELPLPIQPDRAAASPAPVKLPPWLAATPEQAAPIQRVVEPSAPQPAWMAGLKTYSGDAQADSPAGESAVIPGISSTYKPPEIPGVAVNTAPPAQVQPVANGKVTKKRKEKSDYFGLIWWAASILTLLCVCACIAIIFGPQAIANRVLRSGLVRPNNSLVAPADSYKVTYKVEGAGSAQVAYVDNKGQTVQKSVYLPYTNTMTMPKGTVLLLSAQSLQKRSVHCAILINGREWVRDSYRFTDQAASCSGVLP